MSAEPPLSELAVARPRPALPAALLLSSALVVALVGAAVAQRAFALAAYLLLVAVVPWSPRERLRGAGVLLAYAGIAWCLFVIARAPFGSRVTAVLLPACVAFAVRARALGSEGVLRWVHPRWAKGVTASSAKPLDQALSAALSGAPASTSPAAIDAAIVALAMVKPSAIPDSEADRRAFWISTYNVIALHSERGCVSPTFLATLEPLRTEYSIAGVPLTLIDIKHGLLRGGAPGLASLWLRFFGGDYPKHWAVPLDPR